MKRTLFLVAAIFWTVLTNAQQVVISDDASYTGVSSALLDIHSSAGNMGILIPKVTLQSETDQTTVPNPVDGLLVYHTGTVDLDPGFYFWLADSAKWQFLYSGKIPSGGTPVYWIKPDGAAYIQPIGNDNIKIYDAGESYGFYYNGSANQYGVYAIASSATNPTAAVVGFSDVAGNQTYGYLGYNGTWSSGTGLDLEGMAVYGMVEDPGRTAGFFRTTGNANYASLITYSNEWHPFFSEMDNSDPDANPRGGYFHLNNLVDPNYSLLHQTALLTLSEFGGTTNANYTTGAYVQGYGDAQDGVGLYAVGNSNNTGVGVWAEGTTYGVLASGGSQDYVKKTSQAYGIGIVSNGGLFGIASYGGIYGGYFQGQNVSAYFDGKTYSNDISVQLIDNGDGERVPTYTAVSEKPEIILRGQGKLVDGKAVIKFNPEIAKVISDKDPVYVVVTPTGPTKGVYVSYAKADGFEVVENQGGKSTVTFNWIAIATRKGYEQPEVDPAVLNADFDRNMEKTFNNLDNRQGETVYRDGDRIIYGKPPRELLDTRKKQLDAKKIKPKPYKTREQ